ncbi:MAG TPA: RHS repeat-associated core domain-containing protein [Solirubrobacteraceae bacterium]|nr:RHS repeat-associated core domain-containing protein [Solirubrobacteraceae bacterium]
MVATTNVAAMGSLESSFVQEEAPLSLTEPILGVPPVPVEQAAVDAASRTKYEGLDQAAAVALAKQTFHVERPAWTPPGEGGGQITKYLGENSAVERLPGGAHTVVSSTIPLRVDNGSGLAPMSLTLSNDGEAFMPANPVVPVAISTHAEGGLAFPGGLSVAPVSMASESPVLVGNSVMFANAALDTDLLAEPRPGGAEISWQLRSQEAPADEALAFNLPAGVVLQWSTRTPGGVEVLEEGVPILLVAPATAVGADGAPVPVSYEISGNVLTTHVDLSGNVDFPVLVDPTFYGFYGAKNGANVWSGWTHSSNWATPVYEEYFNLIKIGTNPGASIGSSGGLFMKAPGLSGKSGSAGITRVDLTGVTNGVSGQSRLIATINESNGPAPVYSYNGMVGATELLPLYEPGELSNRPIAFCASGAGGHDGGGQPLCEVANYQGSTFLIENEITGAPQNHFNWIQMEGAQITYRDPAAPNKVVLNTAGYAGAWLKTGPTNWKIEAEDEGLGIAGFELHIPAGASPIFTQTVSCNVQNGFTGCPTSYTSEPMNLSGVNKTGALQVAPAAKDAAENNAEPSSSYVTLYLDQTAPVIGALTGTLGAAAGGVIGNGNYTLDFAPVDGSTSSPQSGVTSVEIKVDGSSAYTAKSACAAPIGVPAAGCFGLSGSWVMNGQAFGAGPHTVTVVAKDWVGNESTQSFSVTVNEAAYSSVGPGAVNLETGDFKLSTSDVSVSGGAVNLEVGRTYDSRLPSQGAEGPLGPQWVLSPSGAWHNLTVLQEGTVALYNTEGTKIMFAAKEGGGYMSPAGYQLYTLTKVSSSEYQITDTQGNYTRFTQLSGGSSYYPSSAVQASAAGGLNKVKYSFTKTAEGIIEPVKVLAPEPSEGACTASLVKGCRALTFNYATSTTATGEAPGEWGDFKGRLTRVFFTAWDPVKGEMTTSTVAQYAYDKQGRLRAEWNPLISPALKASYGYDAEQESHVTAVNAPARQPWLLNYGSIPGDLNHGRLLSVTSPNAATALGNGIAPQNTATPALSTTTPVLGAAVSVTNGTWSNSALAYSYQWEDCNSSGAQCHAIGGATNQTYTPIVSDAGHTLVAQVFAVNAGGTSLAATAASAMVPGGTEPTQEPIPAPPNPGTNSVSTIEYHVPISGSGAPYPMDKTTIQKWAQTESPAVATAIFPGDEPEGWPAQDYKRASIFYMDSANRTVNTASPGGGISTTEYDTANNITRTLSPNNRAAALAKGSESETFAKQYSTENTYSTDDTELTSTQGPLHTVKLASGTEVSARNLKQYFYDELAPEEKTFHLVTRTTEAAEYAGQNIADQRSVITTYSGQENLGWTLHAPTASLTTTGGDTIASATKYEPSTGNVTETQAPTGTGAESIPSVYAAAFGVLGSEPGQFKEPRSAATRSTGNVLVLDSGNSRVEEFSSAGTYLAKFGSLGTGNGQLKTPYALTVDAAGNTLVTDFGNSRVEEFNASGVYQLQFGSAGTAGGQFKEPRGIAIGTTGNIFVADSGNHRIEKFNASGTFLETFGFGVKTGGTSFEICKMACKAGLPGTGNGQFKTPRNIAITASGNLWVIDAGNNRIEELTEAGEFLRAVGTTGTGNGQFTSPIGIAVDTASNVIVTDSGNNRLEKFTPTGGFLWAAGVKGAGPGQFEEPAGLTSTASGSFYVTDLKNNRVQRWVPEMSGNPGAHKTQTIYYTAAANATYPACGSHPEWASLPCQAQPAAQPESGLPNLPVTTYPSYNVWNEPLSVVDTIGSTKRTTTITYDAAGRTSTTAISSTVNTPLPTVTNEYNTETGALKKQSTTVEGVTKSISSIENSLGQLTSYTDADGTTTTYEYETEKDFRLIKTNDGKGTQTDGYGTTTGRLVTVKDSAAGTFTGTYDIEGNITNLGYPNGMSANYAYNTVGEPVNLEYVKTTNCASNCKWFTDAVTPSIHGQWLSQTSSLSKQAYRYDGIGRLTEAQDTPQGSGCTTRLYAFDEVGNRTSQTSREPGTEGKCATAGGSTQTYAYDTGDRLNETGVSYDTFGNTTSLPAADAGGSALTSTYYVNNRAASLTQNGQTISYKLDPAGRAREAIYTGTINQTTINHYAAPGDSPAWSITGAVWSRNIPGITGLAAIQTNGGTPILQLANLHGDIIATAALSETETKLLSTSDTTEYGVPRTASPAKYSWLGSAQRPTELSSGAINMGARTYIPQLGRFAQTDPQPGGSINSYAYTFGDPVNQADPSGGWTNTVTYDYEAAENGIGDPNLPETWIGPGAILPPPVNQQLVEEFIAHPPWSAQDEYNDTLGGGIGLHILSYGAAYGGPYNRVHHTSNGNSGYAGPCRSGGRKVNGKCQPGGREEPSNFCYAFVTSVGSPAMFTPQGLAGIALGYVGCAIAKATHQ